MNLNLLIVLIFLLVRLAQLINHHNFLFVFLSFSVSSDEFNQSTRFVNVLASEITSKHFIILINPAFNVISTSRDPQCLSPTNTVSSIGNPIDSITGIVGFACHNSITQVLDKSWTIRWTQTKALSFFQFVCFLLLHLSLSSFLCCFFVFVIYSFFFYFIVVVLYSLFFFSL